MKKILFAMILSLFILPAVFASPDEYEVTNRSDKIFGVAPGVRFSVLGVEPTVALNIYNLELEGACAFSSGLDGKKFGVAPSFSVAYNTNPFEKGTSAVFGLEYMYLTPSYTNMLNKTVEKNNTIEDEEELPGVHSLSLFYKGTYNFNKVFGLLWRVKLPVMIMPAERVEGDIQNLNITNFPGFLGCTLIGFCLTSVGVRFVF